MKITTEDIQVGFHARQILKGISIESKDKELVGIIGPNGSGKSTLLKCIYRILKPDAGAVYLDGEELHSMSVKSSARKMAVVAQHNYYNFDFTVREVVLMGRAPHKKALERDNAKDYRIVEEALKTVQMDAFADRTFSTLSGGEQQRVILARALAQQTPALILDEPTSSLDEQEVEKLFGLMRDLRSRGVGIIFVTHFLDQVYEVCDKITVLRDGKLVGEYEIKDLPRVKLVAKMLGKELDDEADIKDESLVYEADESIPPVIEVEGLQSNAGIKPFDFNIRKGEVNGFTGLLGSGRSECVRAIFGADRVTGGTVKKSGKAVKINKPLDAMKQGIAYLPEDRMRDGIVGDLSVRDNIILAAQVLRGFFKPFSKAQANKFADEYIKLLEIKTASADTPIKSLSGGNQQKVILARWLLTHPEYLILDEPTRGIDIGTKVEIQKLVLKLASEGMSVTFISSETDEMLRTCSRLIVMRDRKKVGELSGEELSQSSIMDTIAGGDKE